MKSQLELYLEQIDERTQANANQPSTLKDGTHSNRSTTSTTTSVFSDCYYHSIRFAEKVAKLLLQGFCFDVTEAASSSLKRSKLFIMPLYVPSKRSTSAAINSIHQHCEHLIAASDANAVQLLRRWTLRLMFVFIVTHNATVIFKHRSLIIIMLLWGIASFISLFVYTLLLWHWNHLWKSLIRCQHTVSSLLSIIKRLQLVSMGRMLSHPLPPVGRLECKQQQQQDMHCSAFTCRETRAALSNALHAAVLELRMVLSISLSSLEQYDDGSSTIIKLLQQLLEESVVSERNATASAVVSIASLEVKADVLFGQMIPLLTYSIILLLQSADAADSDWSLITSMIYYCKQFNDIVTNLHHAVDSIDTIGIPMKENCNKSNDKDTHNTFSDHFLTVREKLCTMRAAYESMSYRLWLMECELSQATAALSFLSSDEVIFEREANQLEALSRCCNRSIEQLINKRGLNEEMEQAVKLQLAHLPTKSDHLFLINELQLLQQAIDAKQSPADFLKSAAAVERDQTEDPSNAVVKAAVTTTDAVTASQNQMIAHNKEKIEFLLPGQQQMQQQQHTKESSSSHDINVMDIFMTTIPNNNDLRSHRSLKQHHDANCEEEERKRQQAVSQHMLFRELSSTLQQVRHAQKQRLEQRVRQLDDDRIKELRQLPSTDESEVEVINESKDIVLKHTAATQHSTRATAVAALMGQHLMNAADGDFASILNNRKQNETILGDDDN